MTPCFSTQSLRSPAPSRAYFYSENNWEHVALWSSSWGGVKAGRPALNRVLWGGAQTGSWGLGLGPTFSFLVVAHWAG